MRSPQRSARRTVAQVAAAAAAFGLGAVPATAQRPNPAAGIQVSGTTDASALVSTLLGPGVTVIGTPTLFGQSDGGGAQQAVFGTVGSTGLGFGSGIILSNGYASNAIGPDSHSLDSTDLGAKSSKSWGSAGSAALSGLIGGTRTNDADVLSFSFTVAPTVKDLAFTYVYGTNEFPDYTNSFTDPFGFFVDGKDIALIPGSNDPVTVQTLTAPVNSAFFVNNLTGSVNAGYNALSVPLLADVSSALDPSLSVHTITLAVADSSDTLVDTGVYIQAGSFTQGGKPATVPEPSPLVLLALGLPPLVRAACRRRRSSSSR